MQWLLLTIVMCPAYGGKFNNDPKICELKVERFNTVEECVAEKTRLYRTGSHVCFKVAAVQ